MKSMPFFQFLFLQVMCVYLTLSLCALWSIRSISPESRQISLSLSIVQGLDWFALWVQVDEGVYTRSPGLLHFTKGKGGDKDPKLLSAESALDGRHPLSTWGCSRCHRRTAGISSKPEEIFSMET